MERELEDTEYMNQLIQEELEWRRMEDYWEERKEIQERLKDE